MITQQQQTSLARSCNVLSAESRLCILQILADARKPVNQEYILKQLADQGVELSQQTVSYTLGEAGSANLVAVHRVGRNRLYSINTVGVLDCLLYINNLHPESENEPHATTETNLRIDEESGEDSALR
jgi:DNA-binding transcriptional ArsR family regulator